MCNWRKANTISSRNSTCEERYVWGVTLRVNNGARVTYLNSGLGGVAVSLTAQDSGVVPRITATNETGYYKFTNVEVGNYCLDFSKSNYNDKSTMLTVQSG
ncbi:Carboxypeptidase regulatory-like domain-containing protein [Candidatus Methanophagaceae archaeon]|nr:Carboxypeptidase regulatory-like domain-containing protein [Methanophagales archaeon]